MRNVLFVITTRENMGDLALCEEWIGDLGREEFRFGFVVAPNIERFIDERDARFPYLPTEHVGDTIAAAVRSFEPDAVIVASNSFWTMPGQLGATFGAWPEQLLDLDVPVLSFDPFEMGFRTRVSHVDLTFEFPAVPDSVWSLRYMSRVADEGNVRHFCTRSVFDRARAGSREDVLRAVGADPNKRTVFFPLSHNRFVSVIEKFPAYYPHLARIFSDPRLADAQFIVVSPVLIPGLSHLPNVVNVPHVPFDAFLRLIAASDVYLSDSMISSMVNGFHLAVPVMLLANSASSEPLAPGTFLEGHFFPYKVFPYGFTEVCDDLIDRFEVRDCFIEAEILDVEACAARLAELLFDSEAYRVVEERCRAWKTARHGLRGPRAVLEDVLAAPRLTATA